MNYKIAAIPGDGIGPEVVREAALILQKIGEEFNHKFEIKYALAGGCAIDE
ncbi:isocitrate/isopropylmalate family dehydrogenase, partial [Clostridium sp.]|uniref:isocitrate/isopropylmalate family dehydrogenase n=1 Tax=Clostridium sp. TaxID=1506 RepID=UPI00267314F7